MQNASYDKFIKNNSHMENVGLHLFTISSNVNEQLILSKQEVVHMSNSTKPFT